MNRVARHRPERGMPFPAQRGPRLFRKERSSVMSLVDAVLRAEGAGQEGTPEFIIAERVTTRLYQGLRDFIGPDGAAFAIIPRFIDRLRLLIGDDILLRLLRDVWPTVGAEDTSPS